MANKEKIKLTRAEKRQLQALMRSRQQRKKPPHSVQETIPYERMWPDGICRVSPSYYTKTVQFWDINYQLAQNEDKSAIFEGWCDFLNAFDSSVHLQLSFLNLTANADAVEQRILLPDKADGFDAIRREYTEMLQNQLAKGSNGLSKRKYLTFGVESENYRTAKPRLERIETDLLNHFKRLGAAAAPLDGRERLKLMYDMFHLDAQTPFLFDWKWLAPTGLRTKDFIVPSSFKFGERQRFGMGSKVSAVSFFSILASELNDRCLAEFLAMDSSLVVSFHLQAIDQTAAIKDINVDVNSRMVCYDIKELGKQLKKLGMLIVQDQVWGRVTANRSEGKSTRYYMDEFHLLLREEQTAAYSVEIWKRFRKWGGIPTGITQNVKDLLASQEVENILENSDFICMLNQASGDREILAKKLGISPYQLSYVTQSGEGEGLLFYGNVILPFQDHFPKKTMLYKVMTTKLSDKAVQNEH